MSDRDKGFMASLDGRVFHVGGYVRDKLLGIESKDMDYVVVGSTQEEMESLGFKKVGADFPVFLCPDGDEYALARTERKTSAGYNGFEVHASPDVTLEDDLERRDLTINAMAMDNQGNIVDPFDGQDDLDKGILRHIGPAFAEDPVRVLRVARFAARYDFKVAQNTMSLMRDITQSGELDALTPERVWLELNKALKEDKPSKFFTTLKECGALVKVFPEIDNLYGVPQPKESHPEVDTGVHTMLVVDQAAKISKDPVVRFAALTHDLGKALSPKEHWPKHHGHEAAGVPLVNAMCDRLKAPSDYRLCALQAAEYHLKGHKGLEMRANSVVKLFNQIDAFRKPENLKRFLDACEADARGRPTFEDRDYPQKEFLNKAYEACQTIQGKDVVKDGFTGKKVGEEIYRRRIDVVKELKLAFEQKSSAPENDVIAQIMKPKSQTHWVGEEVGDFNQEGISLFKDKDNNGSYRFVFAKDGEIVSALQMMSRDGDNAVIANVSTLPEHRRKGLASILLTHACKFFSSVEQSTDLTEDGKAFAEATRSIIEGKPKNKGLSL